jgi:cystathionine beta-lyase
MDKSSSGIKYDFDTVVSRKGTNSYKWNFFPEDLATKHFVYTERYFEPGGPIPVWVADMDFKTAQPIIDALVKRASHGIFGYTGKSPAYFTTVCHWMKKRHHWDIQPEWIVPTPGTTSAIHILINTFTSVSEKVLIPTPAYFPFMGAALKNGRQPLMSPLKFENRRYTLDLEDLEEKARDPLAKIMFLCNPHNPVGRVWSREELTKVGEICLRNNVIVISDEVHLDTVYKGHQYTPFASISTEFALNSIASTSVNKAFNLGGVQAANLIVSNEKLRQAFERELSKNGYEQLNPFGLVAVEAAYNHGEEWLEQCLAYLEENLNFLDNYLKEKLPEVELVRPEGTHLAWLDFRKLGMYRDELHNFIIEKAGVVFDDGYVFGDGGDGFQRLNFACPRSVLEDVLNRVERAIHG